MYLNFFSINYVSPDFNTEFGYLPRTDVLTIPVETSYRYYPESNVFKMISPIYYGRHTRDSSSGLRESYNFLGLSFTLPHQTQLRVEKIFASEVFAAKRFDRGAYGMTAESQLIKQIRLSLSFRKGKYICYDPQSRYHGKGTRASIGLMIQPVRAS